MLNLLKFKPGNGRLEYARYGAVATAHVVKRGGRILLTAAPVALGDQKPDWDLVAIVRYPSRKAFLDMIADPDYLKAMPHRQAGLESTVLYAFHEDDVLAEADKTPVDADLKRKPSDPKDGPVFAISLVKYKPDGGRQEYARYAEPTRTLIARRGGRVEYRLAAEQPLVSPEEWDQLAIVMYPSLESLRAMLASPEYEANVPHRTAGAQRSEFLVTRKIGLQ
jgi:uncharacterized protein (DUF1330 family)